MLPTGNISVSFIIYVGYGEVKVFWKSNDVLDCIKYNKEVEIKEST